MEQTTLYRKYRPQQFADVIGQNHIVKTLESSAKADRIAHAYLFTGSRGTGKTSVARIFARAIGTSQNDIYEMDAASNTGVDDVREIIEAVRYASVSARYKIYIVDEVHMLSKNAFNALLKTLEEPPPHVKFIFATTEVNKVPVTVLSRCQRFDLRRVPAETLARHFADIVTAEGATAEPEALALIARAAEGSVRDGLSVLDQALARGLADAEAGQVKPMSDVVTRLASKYEGKKPVRE
jgi:DNA polymerase-3 subunit gamma/tau